MDPVIIAAIITAVGVIIAAFIAKQKGESAHTKSDVDVPQKELPPISISSSGNDTHISKEFAVGVLLVLICSTLFGGSHVLGKYVITAKSDPILVVTIRNIIAGLVILIFSTFLRCISQEKDSNIKYTKDSLYMIIGKTLSGVFYFAAFLYLSATSTVTLYKLNPIYTFIILLFLIKKPLTMSSFTNVIIGIVIAISGSILSVHGLDDTFSLRGDAVAPGILYIVLASFFWSVFMVSSEKHKDSHVKNACLWQRQKYVANIYLISSIPFVLLLLAFTFLRPDITDIRTVTIDEILLIMPLGLFSGVIGILYFEALKRISPLLISVIISLEIFFTMIFESLFIGTDLGWYVFIGGLLVAVGAISVGRESRNLSVNTF